MRLAIPIALLLAAALPAIPSMAWAQAAKMDMVTGSGQVKWAPAPPSLPKGAMIAVISGDPAKDGPYVVRLKLPANYTVPAHRHPTVENITVMSGSFHVGMGTKRDVKKAMSFGSGGFVSLPARTDLYVWTTKATVLQVHGTGPLAAQYVNLADDPSKQ